MYAKRRPCALKKKAEPMELPAARRLPAGVLRLPCIAPRARMQRGIVALSTQPAARHLPVQSHAVSQAALAEALSRPNQHSRLTSKLAASSERPTASLILVAAGTAKRSLPLRSHLPKPRPHLEPTAYCLGYSGRLFWTTRILAFPAWIPLAQAPLPLPGRCAHVSLRSHGLQV